MINDILQKVARREPLTLLEQDIYNAWAKEQEDVGARISELEEKQQQIDGVVGSITPKAAPLTKVSQITNDLGDMIAGRFIAPASAATSTEPTNTGFSGAFVSGDGETFNGDEYHIGGVRNGLLQFGLNADDGKAYAGGGAVVLDEDGIVIPQGGDAIDFSDDIYSEHALLSFRTYPDSDASLLELYVYQLESEDTLISNGTFASGDLTDWTETDPGGKISVASTDRGYAALFATGASASEYLTQNLSTTASNGMVVKLKAKSSAGTAITVGNSTTYQRLYSPGLNEWRNYVFFIYVSSADLKIYTDGTGDTYIDDIEVTALLITATTVPSVSSIRITPSTVSLAGASSPTTGLSVSPSTVQANPFGGDVDFKVRGSTDDDLLVVDAGLDAIGIGGEAQSGYKLKVSGKVNLSAGNTYDINGSPHTHTGLVTNGDSHDHSGGDGGQIAYGSLSGAPGSDGWNSVPETWTYASADDPVYQIYVSGDVTADPDYKLGNKAKCTNNSTTFQGFIVKVGAYDAGNTRTPVDIYGGTDYDLVNSAITAPYISKIKSPDGFPLDPTKWVVSVSDTNACSKTSPTATSWYGGALLSSTGPSINIPIGAWIVSYKALVATRGNSATDFTIYATLSTANNTESDTDMTAGSVQGAYASAINLQLMNPVYVEKPLLLTTKTTYYLNVKTNIASMTNVQIRGDLVGTSVKAVCAYL